MFSIKKRLCQCDIVRDYELAPSLLYHWIRQAETTGSFQEKENRTQKDTERIALRKRNKQLEFVF